MMDRRMTTAEARRVGTSRVVEPVETEFLDLDGDGVPDAVRTTRTIGFDVTHDGHMDIVEVKEELASGIDVDGTPRVVHVTDTVETDFQSDGSAASVETVDYDLDPNERTNATSSTRDHNMLGKHVS